MQERAEAAPAAPETATASAPRARGAPGVGPLAPGGVLALQQSAGNAAVGRLLRHVAPHGIARQAAPTATPPTGLGRFTPTADPTLDQLPFTRGIDNFTNVFYDLDYRSVDTNYSKYLVLEYADGTVMDINIDEISDATPPDAEIEQAVRDSYLGREGRVFPKALNAGTTPRLAAAKQAAIEEMSVAFLQFLGVSMTAVMFIITMGIGQAGRAPTVRRVAAPKGGIPKLRGFKMKVPTLQGADLKSLFREALDHLKRTPPAQRKEMWKALAQQIEQSGPGKAIGWKGAQSMPAKDGATIFFGDKGPALVVDKAGSVFRGSIANQAHIKITKDGPVIFYEAMEKLF
jgi:hypothetical protein